MNELLIYAGKAVTCSALLYVYYLAALRNRSFHRFNRFYLLAVLSLSLLIPLLRWTIGSNLNAGGAGAVRMLRVVGSANDYVEGQSVAAAHSLPLGLLLRVAYGAVSLVLTLSLLRSLWRMNRLMRRHTNESLGPFQLYDTELAAAPFTFFRSIFWNRAIDRNTLTGRRILEHELVHARQGHSWDVLIVQVALIVCWFNPVFWLLRRELREVHEFIADHHATQGDRAGLAAMILQAAYPGRYDGLVQPFFQTPIKRRLRVLDNGRASRWLGRLLALPLLALVIMAFAVRTAGGAASPKPRARIYMIVIDAAHGYVAGKPTGARREDANEDDIVLAIAQQVQASRHRSDIRFVLTRDGKENLELKDRVDISERMQADFFVSLHMNAQTKTGSAEADGSGIEVFVSKDSSGRRDRSLLLASALQQQLGNYYPVHDGLLELMQHVWVIDHNACPAVLVEMGYITNDKDAAFMRTSPGQRQMASAIVTAITQAIDASEAKNK